MLSHPSLKSVRRLSILLLGLCAFSCLQAQTATAPTASLDPETLDQALAEGKQ